MITFLIFGFLLHSSGVIIYLHILFRIRIRIKFSQQYNKNSKLFGEASTCCAGHSNQSKTVKLSCKSLHWNVAPRWSNKNGFKIALSMEYLMHDHNPFKEDDLWYDHQIWSYFVSVVLTQLHKHRDCSTDISTFFTS